MLEWHIYEDERAEMNLPVEGSQGGGLARRFIIGVVLLTMFGLFLLVGWQVMEGEEAMREDLRALIYEEERVRAFGLKEEAAKFLAPDVPDEWKRDYLATFTAPDQDQDQDQGQAGALQVDEVLFDGEAALVSVRRDEQLQMRYYRLVGGAWRRAPLPTEVWGESAVVSAANGIEISYRERDKAFAHALARDLDGLEQLPTWSEQLSLRIEPAELQGALLVQSIPLSELGFMRRAKTQIVLNSPLTVDRVDSKLDGQTASSRSSLRLALADVLIQPITPHHLSPAMLGVPKQALRTVAAIQWALSVEEQAQLRALWQGRAEESKSPYFSATSPPNARGETLDSPNSDRRIEPFDPSPAEATALLVADHLYQSAATKRLFAIVSQLAKH
ncbi:MAG: hypothetical protein ACPGWR_13510 [Ardenticatenaceae bacterium]